MLRLLQGHAVDDANDIHEVLIFSIKLLLCCWAMQCRTLLTVCVEEFLIFPASILLFEFISWQCLHLQCFDTVGWASGRPPACEKFSVEVLAWLSVSIEVQMIWCHCHPIISRFVKIILFYPFWCRLIQAVLEKRLLNGYVLSIIILCGSNNCFLEYWIQWLFHL